MKWMVFYLLGEKSRVQMRIQNNFTGGFFRNNACDNSRSIFSNIHMLNACAHLGKNGIYQRNDFPVALKVSAPAVDPAEFLKQRHLHSEAFIGSTLQQFDLFFPDIHSFLLSCW